MQIKKRGDLAFTFLALEFILLMGGIPLLLLWLKSRTVMIVILWATAVIVYIWLHRSQGRSFREEWNWKGMKGNIRPVMVRFMLIGPALLAFMALLHPDRLFSFPLERFETWAKVMILYPLLSVIPQEMIYKTLFFGRYVKLFGNGYWLPLIASALAFGYMHVMLGNVVAVTGTMVAGLLISHSYLKSRSLALASFEHALYGCWVYTIGLGIYFYTGAAWGLQAP